MACLARLVIPGVPIHVTQRGNRRGHYPLGTCTVIRAAPALLTGTLTPTELWHVAVDPTQGRRNGAGCRAWVRVLAKTERRCWSSVA